MNVYKIWDPHRKPLHLSAEDMVHIAMQDAEGNYGDDVIRLLAARLDALADVVSRMLDRMPQDQWLELTGLGHTYTKAPD